MNDPAACSMFEKDICNTSSIESIECSSVCTDGFEVTNLISGDSHLRGKGFLAANFVRPLVVVTLNFKCRCDIDTIVIGISIGEQVVSALEVVTVCESSSRRGQVFNRERKLAEFVANPEYYPKYLVFSRWELQQEHCRVSATLLTGVKRLRIRIKAMKNAGTPCLSSLNLFCRQECNNLSTSAYFQPKGPTTVDNEIENSGLLTDQVDGGGCPEEFKDAITHEFMSRPYLLPSAFNIDESSVIKITELAESQGRLPYDPFSYQEFSLSNRPIENTSLLDRIRAYNRNTRITKSRIIQKFS